MRNGLLIIEQTYRGYVTPEGSGDWGRNGLCEVWKAFRNNGSDVGE